MIVLDLVEVFMHDFQFFLNSSAANNELMDQVSNWCPI